MKFSKSLINFDEETSTPNETQEVKEVAKPEVDPEIEAYNKIIEAQKAHDKEWQEKYKDIVKSGKAKSSNGITSDYIDIGEKAKEIPGKVAHYAKRAKEEYVRDAKEAYHGLKGEVADKRDEKGNPISYKKKDLTLFKTEEDAVKDKIARLKGERAPNNNALVGTTGARIAEVAAPFAAAGAFGLYHLFKRKKKKRLYRELLDEGYSPDEAREMTANASEQCDQSNQTNFNAANIATGAVKGISNATVNTFKWLLEHGIVAPFKGRKVTTAYNPATGKVEPFREGIRATKDVFNDKGVRIAKKGDYIREGGVTGAANLPSKIGMGVMGAANVGLTASLLTMPAGVAADFKRDAEYKRKYTLDPEKHYVVEQDLADNKKVRIIGKTSGYEDRTDANIEAERHAGGGMYQVYAIKGSELARVYPRRFTLEYNGYEY